jgi:hypothetical protein
VKLSLVTLTAFAITSGAGCSAPPPPTLTITQGSSPPVGDGITYAAASIPVGIVLEVDVTPSGYSATASITASVDDPTVASVVPMTTRDAFAVIGLAQGETAVHFFVAGAAATDLSVNGETTNALTVAVSTQPPPTRAGVL